MVERLVYKKDPVTPAPIKRKLAVKRKKETITPYTPCSINVSGTALSGCAVRSMWFLCGEAQGTWYLFCYIGHLMLIAYSIGLAAVHACAMCTDGTCKSNP